MFIHTYEESKYQPDSTTWHVASFEMPRQNRPEITSWCYQTFGAPGFRHLTHDIRWKDSIQYGEVYFSHQKDLEWFILRWS